MKKLAILSVLVVAVAVPAEAMAHTLSGSSARSGARGICAQINEISADVNPYTCDGLGSSSRVNAHAINVTLRLHDPNDGERCTARIRVKFRSRSSFRTRAFEISHTCLADAFAGLR